MLASSTWFLMVLVHRCSSMAVGLQVVGLLLGVASWCLQSSCTSSQVWRMRSHLESVSSSERQFEGLWMSCAATSLGSTQCVRFKTVLGLPGELRHADTDQSQNPPVRPSFLSRGRGLNWIIASITGQFDHMDSSLSLLLHT